ncbi:MAG TPA: OsmC family protein [Lentimicrobium sp.]|nr:OsmC family protein [Lentimicrobium sp.]
METIIDKSKEVRAAIWLVNDKLHFMGEVEGNELVSIDYIPPLGDNLGYTSLELLLLSLSSCVGSAVLTFLRRMNRRVDGCQISCKGTRRQEHPTGFESIRVSINIESPDVTEADMQKVIAMAEDKYCPVYSMIKGNTKVVFDYVKEVNNSIAQQN